MCLDLTVVCHGRVQDEQALLVVPPDAPVCSTPCPYARHEAAEEEVARGVAVDRQKLKEYYKVLCSDYAECTNWNRDVTATVNMLALLESDVCGQRRTQTKGKSEKRNFYGYEI